MYHMKNPTKGDSKLLRCHMEADHLLEMNNYLESKDAPIVPCMNLL